MSVYGHVYLGEVGEDIIDGFPHVFELKIRNFHIHCADLHAWCAEQFGRGWDVSDGYLPANIRWIYNYRNDIAFRHAEDAFAFRMRWC